MKALLEYLCGSGLRAKVLTQLLVQPGAEYYIRELERLLGEDSTNLSRELRRMESFHLVESRKKGRMKYYRFNQEHPLYPELYGAILKVGGTVEVLSKYFKPVPGAEFLVLFQPKNLDQPEFSMDLLLMGDVDYEQMNKAIIQTETKLDQHIRMHNLRVKEFQRKVFLHSLFLTDIFTGTHTVVFGNPENWDIQKLKDIY